jgi:hypothetical protein
MEWRIKHEARSGWGEVETIEVAHFKRRVVGDRPVPRPGKAGAELQRLVLQTQMEEYTFASARGLVDLSFSSLADLLPDRCTPRGADRPLNSLRTALGAQVWRRRSCTFDHPRYHEAKMLRLRSRSGSDWQEENPGEAHKAATESQNFLGRTRPRTATSRYGRDH